MERKNGAQFNAAYRAIRDKIIAFELAPGTQVSDNQLAAELGMSRAPVREALMQLAADGLVERDAQKRLVITPLGLPDIIDILQVRRALEVEAVRIIAGGGWLSPAQEAELEEKRRMLADSITPESLIENHEYDDVFHSTIIGFSGNKHIVQMTQRLNLQMQRARWLNMAVPARQHASKHEHQAITKALLAKDLEAATQAVETHLRNTEETFRLVFEDTTLKQVLTGVYSFYHQR